MTGEERIGGEREKSESMTTKVAPTRWFLGVAVGEGGIRKMSAATASTLEGET